MSKKRRSDDDGILVYSSGPEGPRAFGPGGKVTDVAGAPALADLPPARQKIRIVTEKRPHGTKVVTVVRGLALTRRSLEKLAKQLKQQCGVGGTVEGGTVVVQGDHGARIEKILSGLGYVVW